MKSKFAIGSLSLVAGTIEKQSTEIRAALIWWGHIWGHV